MEQSWKAARNHGSREDAINYGADHGFAWRNTPRALMWVRGRVVATEQNKPAPRAERREDGALAQALAAQRLHLHYCRAKTTRKINAMRVSAADFQQKFGSIAESAMSEPVTITRGGRDELVLLSAAEYDRLKRRDRRVVRLEDFTEEEMALIAKAEVPAEYGHLDAELKDWRP